MENTPVKVDFVFVYEVKQRELDSILLLAAELENRGFTVAFINTWYAIQHYIPRYHAKVVVVSACYNSAVYEYFTSHVEKFEKVVDLQWEQVRHRHFLNDPNIDNNWSFSGVACQTRHVCWGENTKARLLNKFNIKEEFLFIGGYLPLDYYRKQFRTTLLNKTTLYEQYGLKPKVKTVLFVSSFTFSTLPQSQLRFFQKDLKERLQLFFTEQHVAVLSWIDKLLTLHPEVQFIYRPHPAECRSERVTALAEKHKNFFLLAQESIKQWFFCVDKVYNWNSTSMIEAYASGTETHLLHPLPINPDFSYPLYDNCRYIDTFEKFKQTVLAPPIPYRKKKYSFPISTKVLAEYYSLNAIPSYIRICDYLCSTYQDSHYRSPGSEYTRPQPTKDGEEVFEIEFADEASEEYNHAKVLQNYENPMNICKRMKKLKSQMGKRWFFSVKPFPLDSWNTKS